VPDKGEKEQGKNTKKTGSKKRFIFIVLLVLILLGGSAAGAYFFLAKPGGAQEVTKKEKEKPMEVMELGEMLVNLNSNSLPHYLRVKITLEYPADKKLAAELKKKKHQLSDVTITTLRAKTLAEVSSAGSVDTLKRELLEKINGQLESGRVTAIYFTDYLVQ